MAVEMDCWRLSQSWSEEAVEVEVGVGSCCCCRCWLYLSMASVGGFRVGLALVLDLGVLALLMWTVAWTK